MNRFSKIKVERITLYMVGAILAVVLLSYKFTIDTQRKWALPKGAQTIAKDLAEARSDVQSMSLIEPTKPKEDNWQQIVSSADLVGVSISPVVIKVKGLDSYQGNLSSWSGVMTGDPLVVFSLIEKLQKEMPLYLYTYSLDGKVLKINFTCVGS